MKKKVSRILSLFILMVLTATIVYAITASSTVTSSRDRNRGSEVGLNSYTVTQEDGVNLTGYTSLALVNTAGITTTTIQTPEIPRNFTATLTDAATTTGLSVILTITGIDQFGNSVTEVTSNLGSTALTFTSSTVWLRITSIQRVVSGVSGADKLDLDWGRKLGLGIDIGTSSHLFELVHDTVSIRETATFDFDEDAFTPPAGDLAGSYSIWGRF